MKSRVYKPILFSTEMVKAILEGSKTQTRRIIKDIVTAIKPGTSPIQYKGINKGDILWVRETFIHWNGSYQYKPLPYGEELGKWKPSIHMPKEAARIFLRVINVRVERLNDISEKDAMAEGVSFTWYDEERNIKIEATKSIFLKLWKEIYPKSENNPFVFVYEFEVIDKPKDF